MPRKKRTYTNAPVLLTYGWRRDLPDQRDRLYKFELVDESKLPTRVSMRDKMPAVYEQGLLGSCTAQAICALFHYREMNDENRGRLLEPSTLFVYFNTRDMDGTTRVDCGASLRSTIKAVNRHGVCSTRLWPYEHLRFAAKPPQEAYVEASNFRVNSYQRVIQDLPHIRRCLADGSPVAFGFTVYETYESTAIRSKKAVLAMPKKSERMLGGHAALIVGYDDATERFEVRNSYGKGAGKDGYFYMPYQYVVEPMLADDFWTFDAVT